MTQLPSSLTSIGMLCSQLQRSPRSIKLIAGNLGIEPALVLNDVPHFDSNQIELIIQAIHEIPMLPASRAGVQF